MEAQLIWLLYFSAMMIVNYEVNMNTTGDASLRARHLRARAAAAERGYPWTASWSAFWVTIGCMAAGIFIPLFVFVAIVEVIVGKRR
jgi:hypothetical protein